MTEQNGTIKVVSIGPGEAHTQNEITSYNCYICKKEEHEDMALIRIRDTKMGMVCVDHPGVVQEFIRQYRRPPLGWEKTGDYDVGAITGSGSGSKRR
jgi:hypothetical protein